MVGNGETVISQNPGEGHSISKNGTVVLYTEESGETTKVTVPDFTGLSMSAVNLKAADSNLNIVFSGANIASANVVAYKQSVEHDSEVDAGTVVTVYFRSEDSSD